MICVFSKMYIISYIQRAEGCQLPPRGKMGCAPGSRSVFNTPAMFFACSVVSHNSTVRETATRQALSVPSRASGTVVRW